MTLDEAIALSRLDCPPSPAAGDALRVLVGEIERLQRIADAAVRSVTQPAWAGVCDEDVLLESALRDAGLLPPNTHNT
jgi:hypothetical protein